MSPQLKSMAFLGVLSSGLLGGGCANAQQNPASAMQLSTSDSAPSFLFDGDNFEVVLLNGAQGTVERSLNTKRQGASSLKIVKTNALGAMIIRSKTPVSLTQGKNYVFRGYFQALAPTLNSLLLFRLGPQQAENFGNPDGLYEYTAQAMIPASAPGKWQKRIAAYTATGEPNADANFVSNVAPQNTFAHVILYGNPQTIHLADLGVEEAKNDGSGRLPDLGFVQSLDEVKAHVAQRAPVQLRLDTTTGVGRILQNEQVCAPSFYMSSRNTPNQGDFATWGKNGLHNIIVGLEGADSKNNAVFQSAGQYNFKAVDEAIWNALRKNPDANVQLLLGAYAYPNWGAEHPDEVWQDAQGKKGYGGGGFGGQSHFRGFVEDIATLDPTTQPYYYPSYHSRVWRRDMSQFLEAMARHIEAQPYGKVVTGFQIMAGWDGRLQLGDSDFSPAAKSAFRSWLQAKYVTPAALSRAWGTTLASFDAAQVPASANVPVMGADTSGKPYIFDAAVADYRQFRQEDGWQLMDSFAGAVKSGLAKPSVVSVYRDLEPGFLKTKNIDLVGNDSFYPFRRPGWATAGWHNVKMDFHGKMQFQDLDLRSFAGPRENPERWAEWVGQSNNQQEWLDTYRKMVGLSLARHAGYWHFEMWGYYSDPWIVEQVGKHAAIAQKLAAKPRSSFKPDVCLVTTGNSRNFLRVPSHNTTSGFGTGDLSYEQEMALETSGVPHDSVYLSDLAARPELQNYKLYIIPHAPFMSQSERAAIRKLQSNGRTIVWVYDSGYISEKGPDTEAMSQLVGMKVQTEEKWARRTPLMVAGALQNVSPLQGLAETTYSVFKLSGFDGGKAPGQAFWIEDATATPLLRYAEDGKVAGAMKRFPTWTSVYLAAPGGLGEDLLNALARRAGAYVAAPSGNQLDINGHFASIHGRRTGSYSLRVPGGIKTATDPFTNKVYTVKNGVITLQTQAGRSDWLLFN